LLIFGVGIVMLLKPTDDHSCSHSRRSREKIKKGKKAGLKSLIHHWQMFGGDLRKNTPPY